MGRTFRFGIALIRRFSDFAIVCAGLIVVGVILAYVSYRAILPAYVNPKARMYTSGLGYGTMLRRFGKPFPIHTANVSYREFAEPIMGEGVMASQPVLVPILPMAHFTKIHVSAGDYVKKGQLLAELDDTIAKRKLESAKSALRSTQHERNRVMIGSAYVLAQERPKKDQIEKDAAQATLDLFTAQLAIDEKLAAKGVIAKSTLIETRQKMEDLRRKIKQAEFQLDMAVNGVKESKLIAENAIEEAQRSVAHRRAELANHKIYANESGIIESVLYSVGEFNQDSGKPGFMIAAGLWFEAHLDQRVVNRVRLGQKARVYLEAYPGRPFWGKITRIVPIVTFNTGGPEINRPIRPRGSGGPEWPATFKVKIEFDETVGRADGRTLVPGMTGFGQVVAQRKTMSVPLAAVSALSAGSGFVFVVDQDMKWTAKQVHTGTINDGCIEILSGLDGTETIIRSGFEVLNPGDLITVSSGPDPSTSKNQPSTKTPTADQPATNSLKPDSSASTADESTVLATL